MPVHDGQRGHPTIFSATFPEDLQQIPHGHGINWLLRTAAPEKILARVCLESSVLFDLDTPEDLGTLQRLKTNNGRQQADGHCD